MLNQNIKTENIIIKIELSERNLKMKTKTVLTILVIGVFILGIAAAIMNEHENSVKDDEKSKDKPQNENPDKKPKHIGAKVSASVHGNITVNETVNEKIKGKIKAHTGFVEVNETGNVTGAAVSKKIGAKINVSETLGGEKNE